MTAATLIAVEVVALIVCLLVPAMRATSARSEAEEAAGRIREVIHAASSARAQNGAWPPDAGPGRAPEALKMLLPAAAKFDAQRYQLDWDHWRLNDGTETLSPKREYVGISITASDPEFMRLVIQALAKERVYFTLGDRTTFVLSAPGLPPG